VRYVGNRKSSYWLPIVSLIIINLTETERQRKKKRWWMSRELRRQRCHWWLYPCFRAAPRKCDLLWRDSCGIHDTWEQSGRHSPAMVVHSPMSWSRRRPTTPWNNDVLKQTYYTMKQWCLEADVLHLYPDEWHHMAREPKKFSLAQVFPLALRTSPPFLPHSIPRALPLSQVSNSDPFPSLLGQTFLLFTGTLWWQAFTSVKFLTVRLHLRQQHRHTQKETG